MLNRGDVSHFWWQTASLGVACIISSWVHLTVGITPFDDAFIHFRIAENWFTSGVPFFNPAESVYATSSPLFVLLLTLGCFLRLSPPSSAGIICGMTSVLAAFYWGKISRASSRGSWLLITLAFFIIQLPISLGLMETSLALACAGFALFSAGAPFSVRFFFLGLAALARPEFSILTIFFSIVEYRMFAGIRTSSWFFLILAVIGYGTTTLYFFSSLVPHTLAAKRLVYEVTPAQITGQILEYFIGEGAPTELRFALQSLVLAGLLIFSILIFSVKMKGEFFREKTQFKIEFFGLGFSVLTLIGYMLSGVPLFPWYAPLLILPFLSGLSALSALISRSMQLFFFFLTISLSLLICARAYIAANVGIASSPWYPSNERIQAIAEIGREISRQVPGALIASPEIGALGYYSGMKILDGVGLVSPESLKFHPIPIPEGRKNGLIGALPSAIVASRRPDYIVGVSNLIQGDGSYYQDLGYKQWRLPVFSDRVAGALSRGGFKTYLSTETIILYALNSRPIPDLFNR